MDSKLSVEQLQRKAVVYVRQSSMVQVIHNLESQRRQYGLTDRAEELGFRDIEVIDDDLGRSGGGCEERPGFERLVAKVCSGEVGGVICVEASRLARNGRDWHRLIELCALVGTVIIDPEGIYDPSITNDRLLLGLKGTMSEFELNLIRQRSREAIQQKAKRGELQFRLPVGLCWNGDHIELEPDQHCQQVVRLVFQKMQELGSVRQVFRWFLQERLQVPAHAADGKSIFWKKPRYNTIMGILANPFYAGAYAFGRTKIRTRVVDGHVRKFKERPRDRGQWMVLIRDHHPGYISWEQFEIHRHLIDANAHMKPQTPAKAGRGGRALLAGLLRCRRCGRMMLVNYAGAEGKVCSIGAAVARRKIRTVRASLLGELRRTSWWRNRYCGRSRVTPLRRPCVLPNRSVSGKAISGGRWKWDWLRRVIKPNWQSGATRPSIRISVWWRASWKRVGTWRWRRCAPPQRNAPNSSGV